MQQKVAFVPVPTFTHSSLSDGATIAEELGARY